MDPIIKMFDTLKAKIKKADQYTQDVLTSFQSHCLCPGFLIKQHMNFLDQIALFSLKYVKYVRLLTLDNDF